MDISPPTSLFPAAEASDLTDQAYASIRERLLRGQLRMGTAISARSLASELGMSHLPVSQALRRLEHEGLIESRPRAGSRVRIPTETDIRERYIVREALESQAARLFATRATAAQRAELRRMGEHLDLLFNRLAAGDADAEFLFAVHSFHFQLHMRIAEYAGCEALRVLIERNQVLIMNWFYDISANRRALPPRFHRELVEVLAGGDPLAADNAMREHVRYGLEDIVRNLQIQAPQEWRARRKRPAVAS
jgi:DNA-binding GntR family transcriptional regulator